MLSETVDSSRPVLIVDDSPMYRTAAKGMLQRLGYGIQRIDFAQDAKEALQKCTANNYALVLFDYNLGKNANGYQLIEELNSRQLLSPDCVNIIVTGDATPEVVRGFMELEPDGYLLKPLNYATLKQRLPQFSAKKRQLSDILVMMGNNKFQEALDTIEQAFFSDEEIIVRSQMLKAKCLTQLGQLDEARNVLINLKGSSENSNVLLELARIAFTQRQYKQGLFLASQVKKDPLRSAQACDICSEIYAAQQQFDSALEESDAAIATSPKMIKRHEQRIAFNVALFNLPEAVRNIKTLLTESRHSYHDSVEYFLLAASIHLDMAQFGSAETRDSHIAAVARWVEQWRQVFTREQYKCFEALILCRVFQLKGDFHKSRNYLAMYHEFRAETPDAIVSLFENIELVKASFMKHDVEGYKNASGVVAQQLREQPISARRQGWASYFQQYRTKSEQSYSQLLKLKERVRQHTANKHFDKAAVLVSQAVKANMLDSDLCLLTIEVLTKSWPPNWTKLQVAKIAMICKEHLKGTKHAKTKAYALACDTLAHQVSVNELKVTDSATV